jgi:PAS domain S-box-containing protein
MSSLDRLAGRLGFPRQLALTVAFFALTVLCLLGAIAVALRAMSGVRAYVGGEGLWSKAQKAAVRALEHAADGDRHALARFEAAIAVPLGDRRARRELERPTPDPEVVVRGFLAGRNHPDDVATMALIFRRFHRVPHVARAIEIWRRADREILRLLAVGDHVRAVLADRAPSPGERARLRRKIAAIDERTTPLEDAFSATLGDGARIATRALLAVIVGVAAMLFLLGLLLSRLLLDAVRDRDAKRRADAALRSSQARYRELFDTANDLVYSHDLGGRLTSVNEAYLRATGYAREDLAGRDLATLLTPASLPRMRAAMARQLAAGGTTVYELELVAKDGRRIPLETSTHLVVEDGRPRAVHAIARDISERKRTEQALAAEARVAAALARLGRELMSSLETPVLFERLCQVSAEVLGGRAGAIALWDAASGRYLVSAAAGDDRAGIEPALGALASPASAFARGDVCAPDPATLAIALRRGCDVVGVHVVVARTVFAPEDRRIAEGMVLLCPMALANAELVTRLEEASRLRSEFVSTMSHELRTPLNVILGYTEMLRDETDEEARWRLLDRLEASGRDLLELIESTLDLGRIEAGRDTIRLERISLATFLLAVGASCSRFPRRPGVTLRWPAHPPECELTTDPRKLTVVLRNLVGNALKFTEHGFVEVDAALADDAVLLRVRDTGIGIRREDHERIFDIFRQADGSDTRRFGGTGLGLYIVRRYVRQLGGSVSLESAPGEGSVFTVRIPRSVEAGRIAA